MTFGYWEVWNGEISFQSLGFIIGSIANWAKNHQNYAIYNSYFDLKLSTVHLKHIIQLWFCKNRKIAKKKITPTGTFSHISIWGLAQKHLILIGCITNKLVLLIIVRYGTYNVADHSWQKRPCIWRTILQVWRTAQTY